MNTANKSDITFVCCVDSGWLEAQTVIMIESLRRWGGRFAQAPIVAVTPRFGLPISERTRRIFKEFDVEYIHYQANHSYTWLPYVNKPEALCTIEKQASTEYVGWLDSDLLIVNEPEQLFLSHDEDFVACAADKNVGSRGLGDPFEPYWNAICNTIGININDLPWVTTAAEGDRIRLSWNSGIFVYRRRTGFGKDYLNTCLRLIDAKLVPNTEGYFSIGMNEQIGLGLAMFKAKLNWRALPFSHNFTVTPRTEDGHLCDQEQLKTAKILHYHDSMLPEHWDKFLSLLQATYPAVADWLIQVGAMKSCAPLPWKLMSKVLDLYRTQRDTEYRKACIPI